MVSRRPTLVISNVLPERPNDAAYNAHADRMWSSLVGAACTGWNIVREWAQLDGPEGATARARRADAIVIMGGEDLDPHFYGGEIHYTHETRHWGRADAGHIALVRFAVAQGIPLLGICRGMQAIGVALGGTLVQHIPGTVHHNPDMLLDHHFARHTVDVEAGSHLASALGAGQVVVHSAHHQSIARVPECLDVVARSADGIVESVEHRDAPVMGVQWHPEDPESDPVALAALLHLLGAAASTSITAHVPEPAGTGSRQAA